MTQRGLKDGPSNLLHRRGAVVVALVVLVLLVGAGLWIGLSSSGGGPEQPPAPPPQAAPPAPEGPGVLGGIDTNGWKLTLPVEDEDGDIKQVQPVATTEPWLTLNPGGGLLFWAPAVGATTKHSDHPRTELNSLTNFTAGRGVHTLTASVTLLQEPQDGQGIILGQIHGAGDMSSVPYVMLRYQDKGVKVVVKQVTDGEDHVNVPLLANLPLNTRFDFSITDLGNGSMVFTGTVNGQTRRADFPIPAEFANATVRFQAGDYQQSDDGKSPRDGGRVIFHALRESTTAP